MTLTYVVLKFKIWFILLSA